eukprot:447915-Rhodomonas_salina.1
MTTSSLPPPPPPPRPALGRGHERRRRARKLLPTPAPACTRAPLSLARSHMQSAREELKAE